jgi:hypothetical protein
MTRMLYCSRDACGVMWCVWQQMSNAAFAVDRHILRLIQRKMSIVDVVFLTSFLIDHYALQLAAILRHLCHYLYHP